MILLPITKKESLLNRLRALAPAKKASKPKKKAAPKKKVAPKKKTAPKKKAMALVQKGVVSKENGAVPVGRHAKTAQAFTAAGVGVAAAVAAAMVAKAACKKRAARKIEEATEEADEVEEKMSGDIVV